MSVAAVCPVCDECASSAMTTNRRPFKDCSEAILSSTNGNVWIVTTMMSLPEASVFVRYDDFDVESPSVRAFAASFWLIVATMPAAGSI